MIGVVHRNLHLVQGFPMIATAATFDDQNINRGHPFHMFVFGAGYYKSLSFIPMCNTWNELSYYP